MRYKLLVWIIGILALSSLVSAWEPMSYWKGDNDGLDDTDSVNHLNMSTGAWINNSNYKVGTGSFYFDGSSSGNAANFTVGTENLSLGRTVQFWVYFLDFPTNGYLFHWGTAAGNSNMFTIGDDGASQMRASLRISDLYKWDMRAPRISLNRWEMITVVFGGGSGSELWINTTLVTNDTETDVMHIAWNDIMIGGYQGTSLNFNANIDNLAIFSYRLSAQNISDTYNSDAGLDFNPAPAPVISDVCCTSPDPDDCTETYDTGGDLTPTFNFSTDIAAPCSIGDDNSTWTECATTGARLHICTLPSAYQLVWGADKVFLKCLETYDELDVSSSYAGGNVTDSLNALIEGALVTASKNNSATIWRSNVTGADGLFIIGVSPGIYTVCAYHPENYTLRGDCTPHVAVT